MFLHMYQDDFSFTVGLDLTYHDTLIPYSLAKNSVTVKACIFFVDIHIWMQNSKA